MQLIVGVLLYWNVLNRYVLGKPSSGTPGMIYAVRRLNMNWIAKEGCVQHLAHVKVHRHPRAMYPPHSVHKDNITCRGTFARDFECSSRNVSHHWSPGMIDLDVQQ